MFLGSQNVVPQCLQHLGYAHNKLTTYGLPSLLNTVTNISVPSLWPSGLSVLDIGLSGLLLGNSVSPQAFEHVTVFNQLGKQMMT